MIDSQAERLEPQAANIEPQAGSIKPGHMGSSEAHPVSGTIEQIDTPAAVPQAREESELSEQNEPVLPPELFSRQNPIFDSFHLRHFSHTVCTSYPLSFALSGTSPRSS